MLSNEFATVYVRIDHTGNGPRLAVADPSAGQEILLDPLELQALAWSRHSTLNDLLKPAHKEARLAESDGNDAEDAEDAEDDA
ncbi:dihydrodiol dehydrogenase [Jatrophihabitans fulvus]